MKLRLGVTKPTEAEERELVTAVRQLDEAYPAKSPASLPDTYWQNLIVLTNRGIDEVASGKALVISWAARVAIPGVVAVLCFIIGLHYYAPERTLHRSSLSSVVMSLPEKDVDSLLADPSLVDENLSVADVGAAPVVLPKEQVADYLIENGRATDVVEGLSDKQVDEMLAALGSARSH
jgi:hypothetical protein